MRELIRLWASFAALVLGIGVLGGCVSTSAQDATRDVANVVRERSAHRVQWDRGDRDDARARRAIDEVLARPLDVDAAVQIALLESPALRATLEELAIGQADLVQAGLLQNPVFSFGRTAWEAEHIAPNLFASVEASFLDLLTLPLKKRVASAELEATKWRVADAVLELAAEVRHAYYEALAAQQIAGVRALIREAADASAQIAERQHRAGTMNELALQAELGLASRARLDATRSAGEAGEARERLSAKMGLWGARTRWTLPARLPDLPAREVDLAHLESKAIAERLDLRAARHQVQALGAALTLAKTTRWTGSIHVAVEAGRLRGSRKFSFGPSVGIELPLFDQRRAAIARLEAMQRQAESELEALAVDVRAEVRASGIRVHSTRRSVEELSQHQIPIREKLVQLSQQQYDAMLLGVYQLLQAKQAEFDTYRETLEAQRDYWIARSELERAVGSRLIAGNAKRELGAATNSEGAK